MTRPSSSVFLVADPGPWRDRLTEGMAGIRVASPDELDTLPRDAPYENGTTETFIIHLAPGPLYDGSARARLVAVLETLLGRAPRHLILISSAAVNAPTHHHAGMTSEERRSKPRWPNPVAESWFALEETATAAVTDSSADLTILRPAPVVLPDGKDFFSRSLGKRLSVVPAGYDPNLQLLDPGDLARAVETVVARGLDEGYAGGVFNLAPTAPVPLRRAIRHAGGRALPLPTSLLAGLRRLRGFFGSPVPVAELDYFRYAFTVHGGKACQELDWSPTRSSVEVAQSLRRRPARGAEEIPECDAVGLDETYVSRLSRFFFPFLHDRWWRVEVAGLENVPRRGRAVLVGVHRGHQPWDGVMLFYFLRREIGRRLRFLVHPTLVKFPFLAPYMIKCGGVHACRENAAWVLEREGMVGIFPEGIRGAFRMYREAYTLGRFGRDEFVKIALMGRAPLVPVVTVGSAEIFPIFGRLDWSWFKRWSEWPYLPVTPTMGTVPLPSKWHTCFLPPIHIERQYGPEAASDPVIVKAISDDVRQRLEKAIAEMRQRRKAIFWGSIFSSEEPLATPGENLLDQHAVGRRA